MDEADPTVVGGSGGSLKVGEEHAHIEGGVGIVMSPARS